MNGLTVVPLQSTEGRAEHPVKPRSELAHRPMPLPGGSAGRGQDGFRALLSGSGSTPIEAPRANGAAVECSTERSRAPDRQPVAPVEGRAWETPATRTVEPGDATGRTSGPRTGV